MNYNLGHKELKHFERNKCHQCLKVEMYLKEKAQNLNKKAQNET